MNESAFADSVGLFLAEMGKVSLLSREQETALAQEIEMPDAIQHAIIKIKGEKSRTDVEALGISSILSASTGTLLNHRTKTIQRTNASDLATMNKEILAKITNASVMKFTGKTDTIAGWLCRELLVFDLSGDSSVPVAYQTRLSVWVAEEFPEGRDIQRLIDRAIPNQLLAPIEKATGKKFAMPGFALRTQVTSGDQVIRITYTAIKQGDIPESDFDLPKDYLQSLSK